jgi:hypothetical protein
MAAPRKYPEELRERAVRSTAGVIRFLRGGARPPAALIVEFIDVHREEYGVEPICEQLQIAPSTYYAHRSRPPSVRSVTDAATTAVIERVHADNYGVYGARKVQAEVRRQGHPVARCTVERLMRGRAARHHAGEGTADHRPRHRPGHPPGPGRSRVHRDRPGPVVGRRHHLLPDVHRLGLRRLRHRRVLPPSGGVLDGTVAPEVHWRRNRSLISMTADRSLIARLAAHESWAHTADPSARTAPARRALLDRFERQVDPGGLLPPAERARRAEHARKAYFARLALRSAQARRKAPAVESEHARPNRQDREQPQ